MSVRPAFRAALVLSLLARSAALSAPAPQAAGPGLTLVDRGRAVCAIVLPPGAGETERRAAEILRDSVRRMSGAELPIEEKAAPRRDREVWIGYERGVYPGSGRRLGFSYLG